MTTWAISYLVTVGRSIFGEHDYGWASCNSEWNSKNCVPYDSIRRLGPSRHDSNVEYFRGYVLGQQNLTMPYGLSSVTFPGIQVGLTLAGVVIVVFVLAVEVGSKGLSRISILLFGFSSSSIWLLFIRTSSLPGGTDGVSHFLAPDWNQFLNFNAWMDAARLVCTTCGIGLGIHLSHASYNQFSNSILMNVCIPIGVSTLYSVFASILIFSLFGFTAKITSRNITNLIEIHPEFVFEYVPITLPYDISFPTHFYFMIFFAVVICTSFLGTTVRLVNLRLCCAEIFGDDFFGKRLYKWAAIVGFIGLSYALNLPLISNGSLAWIAVHQLLIDNIAHPTLLLLEVIVIAWIVGPKFLNEAHISCTGGKVAVCFIVCWKFMIPPFIFVLLITGIANPTSFVSYRRAKLPAWTPAIGATVLAIMIIIVLLMGLREYKTYTAINSRKLKFLLLISPDYEHKDILTNSDGERYHKSHYMSLGSTSLQFKRQQSVSDLDIEVEEEGFSEAEGINNGDEVSDGREIPQELVNRKPRMSALPNLAASLRSGRIGPFRKNVQARQGSTAVEPGGGLAAPSTLEDDSKKA